MSFQNVNRRVSELIADLEQIITDSSRAAGPGGVLDPDFRVETQLIAQATVELTVYRGAVSALDTLVMEAAESGDFSIAHAAYGVAADLRDALDLAQATLDELRRATLAADKSGRPHRVNSDILLAPPTLNPAGAHPSRLRCEQRKG